MIGKIIFIVIIVAVMVMMFFCYLYNKSKKYQVNAMSSNPIDGLRWGGLLGFKLGDDYDFCLSRFEHLKIAIDEDDYKEHNCDGFILFEHLPKYVVWGRNTYENVKEVSFQFREKILESMSIDIDYSKHGMSEMYDILMNRISIVMGCEPQIRSKEYYKWISSQGAIYLSRWKSPEGGERLLIQVLSD